MKVPSILCLLLVGASVCYAQRLPVRTYRLVAGDSTKSPKKINHYLGIQANQLVNQLINLGSNAPAVSNPYLIIYSFNSATTGWGMNWGFNYTLNTIDASDPVTTRVSTFDDLSFRMGVEKKSFLSKRWMVSCGLDVIWSKNEDETKSGFKSQFNSSSTNVKSSTTYFGYGPRCSLSFFIADRIILGTEATYYYKALSNSQKITNTTSNTFFDPNTGLPITTVESSSNGTSQRSSDFTLIPPVAIFLIFKFQ